VLFPFGQAAEQPAFVDLRLLQPLGDDRRPGPAQPEQRLRRGPRAFALGPVTVGDIEQRLRRAEQERRDLRIVGRHRQPGDAREALGRRHRELAGTQERVEFEQVEPGQLGIAEALPDQRRVEQDDGGVRRDPDRLAAPDRARLLPGRDPDAGMAGVQGWIGERHAADIACRERKGNTLRRHPGLVPGSRVTGDGACGSGSRD
jgi:hypothetical protein